MAALGGLSALLIHVDADSNWAYAFALLATAVGALLFALTRTSRREEQRVPQEAFIGIVYVVASAAAVLIANRVPGGGEAIEKTLTGSILWVNFKPTILKLAAVYAALGVFHYALRHRFLTISFHPEEAERLGWKIRWWDFLFYLSFGVVITLAVPVAGAAAGARAHLDAAGARAPAHVNSHTTGAGAGFPPPDCAICPLPGAPSPARRAAALRLAISDARATRPVEPVPVRSALARL